MGLRRIRDPRLSTEQNQTNILGGQEDQQQQSGGGISGTPEEGLGASGQVTTDAGQAQQQTQTQQQINQATKAPTTPSRSGMFTNIKSYLEKNKPVVQQMGQQAGRQFASTAEKVRQEAASRAKTYKDVLGETEKEVESQIGAGKKAVDVAAGKQPSISEIIQEEGIEIDPRNYWKRPMTQQTESTQPVEEAEQPTLAQYAQRAQETAQQAQELNLQEQAKKAARLQQQASGIVSDAGRQDLLRDVFGRRSRQYSTGAQALDQLLLSQSPQAAQQLQETVQRSSKGLEGISREQQEAQNRLQALRALGAGAGEQLTAYEETANIDLINKIKKELEAEQTKLGQGQKDFIKALKSGENLTPELIKKYIPEDVLSSGLSKMQKERNTFLEDLQKISDAPKWGSNIGHYYISKTDLGKFIDKYADSPLLSPILKEAGIGNILDKSDKHALARYLTQTVDTTGLAPDWMTGGQSYIPTKTRASELYKLARRQDDYNQDDFINRIIEQVKSGKDLSNIYTVTDPESLTEEKVVDPELLAKFNALAKLSGRQTKYDIPEEREKINYGTADLSSISNLAELDKKIAEQLLDEYGYYDYTAINNLLKAI